MEEQRWYVILQYDGTAFSGWQRQPEQRTVQGVLEEALGRLAGRPIAVHAAGRTDAGVHALGQVASFAWDRAMTPAEVARALDALTPSDVRVVRCGRAPPGFHARRHAVSRRYAYHVGTDAEAFSPFRRRYEWALGRALDHELLGRAAAPLAGEHDFRAFAAAGQARPHYRCRVSTAAWHERRGAEGFIFDIEADRFLHRMVRFLVGIAVDVASGRRPPDDVARLLSGTDNAEASPPAPPEGLYLVHVRYPQLDEDVA